jgi:hypothetical protein
MSWRVAAGWFASWTVRPISPMLQKNCNINRYNKASGQESSNQTTGDLRPPALLPALTFQSVRSRRLHVLVVAHSSRYRDHRHANRSTIRCIHFGHTVMSMMKFGSAFFAHRATVNEISHPPAKARWITADSLQRHQELYLVQMRDGEQAIAPA